MNVHDTQESLVMQAAAILLKAAETKVTDYGDALQRATAKVQELQQGLEKAKADVQRLTAMVQSKSD